MHILRLLPQSPVHITETDELVYKSYPNGDRIPDFSFVVIANLSIPFLGWMQKYMFLSWMEMQPVLFSRALNYVASLLWNRMVSEVQFSSPGNYELKGKL